VDHQKNVQLLMWEIGSARTPSFSASLRRPTVLEHLETARNRTAALAAEVSGNNDDE
jgi:hypothetical protein